MTLAIAIGIALIPGVAWLFFYLQELNRPEPKGLIIATFISGAAFSFAALAIQLVLEKTKLVPSPVSLAEKMANPLFILGAVIVFAFVEEFFKFFAAWMTVHDKPDFDKPIDAMIYVVVASLGFATIENLGAVNPGTGQSLQLALMVETISLRFIGATLLHTLAASFMGYYWALGISRFGSRIYIVLGLAVATLLHACFNFLIITYGNLVYTLIFVIVVGLFALGDFEKLKQKTV